MGSKNYLRFLFIFFIFVLAGILLVRYLLYQTQKKSKASGESVTASFSPATFTFTANQDLSTMIKIQPSVDMSIRGYYITVNFDKTKLQLKNIDYKLGTISQGLGDDNSKLSSINQSGVVKIVGEIQAATGYVLSSAQQTDVVSLTFNSISDGNTSITIDETNSKVVKINSDSSLSEIPVVTGSITLSPTVSATTTPSPTNKPESPYLYFYFNPSSVTANKSKEFTTTISIKPSVDMNIRGYFVYVSFGNTLLNVKKIDYKLGIVSGGLGDTTDDVAKINQRGYIKLQAEIQSAPGSPLRSSQQTDTAEITFTSLSSAGSTVGVDAVNSFVYRINADSSITEVKGVSRSPEGDLKVNGGIISPSGEVSPSPVVTAIILTPTPQCKTGVNTFGFDQQCIIDGVWGFRYMYYICYDGYSGFLGEDTSCKLIKTWFKQAEKECEGRSSCVPLPTSIPPSPPPEGPVTISLKLKFQGIMKRPADQFNNLVVKVTAFGPPPIVAAKLNEATEESRPVPEPQANICSQKVNFVADDNGVWSGTISCPNLVPGPDYKILVKGPKHIQKKICNQTPTETYPGSYRCEQEKVMLNPIILKPGVNNLDFSGIYLLVGDLPDQDGIVNSADVSQIRLCLNHGDTDCLRLTDLNLDGVVNAQDYSLVIGALSIRNDEE
jgi:hypothetical protein